jgi:hypothetical protein
MLELNVTLQVFCTCYSVLLFRSLFNFSFFIAENGDLAPGVVVVTTVDELPPPSYTTVSGGAPMVTCRVCQVNKLDTNIRIAPHWGSNHLITQPHYIPLNSMLTVVQFLNGLAFRLQLD